MGRLIRDHDWSKTPLGPINLWPQSLKTAVDIALANEIPTTIMVGRELIHLYNDAYARMIGPSHPGALGRSVPMAFAEVWPLVEPVVERVWRGESVLLERERHPFIHNGNGDLEDAWFTITHGPLRNEAGTIMGVFTVMIEVTAQVRAEPTLFAHEALQAYLLTLDDALRAQDAPLEVQSVAARILGEYLGASRVAYGEVERDDEHIVFARNYVADDAADDAVDDAPLLTGRFLFDDYDVNLQAALAERRTIAVADIASAPDLTEAEREAYGNLGIHALVSVPLTVGGRFVANLTVRQVHPRAWTAEEIALIEETAERTRAAVEHARADQLLYESEETLAYQANILKFIDEAVVAFDPDQRITYWSPGAERMYGWAAGEVIGKTPVEILRPIDYDSESLLEKTQRQAAFQNRELIQGETLHRRKDDVQFWVEYSAQAFFDPSGKLAGFATVQRDVSERKRVEEALRASESNLRGVANIVPDLLWHSEPDGSTTWYNERWMEYTGQTLEQAIGWGWMDAIHPNDREASARRYREATEHNRPLQQEHRIRRHDGTYRWFLVRAAPLLDDHGRVVRMYGAATDIDEQRAEREELAEQVSVQTAQLRDTSRQVLMVQEEERRHLARELHDEIGQALTGLQLRLDAVSRGGDRLDVRALAEADALVRGLTARVRTLSMNLRPAALDALGLLPALLGLVNGYRRTTGITVDLRHHGLDQRFSSDIEIAAYRVIQEALTNVARHAGAATVTVQLLAEGGILTVTVRDDGRGFDRDRTSMSGGLGGMRERVELLSGTFVIESGPESGTLVAAEFPFGEASLRAAAAPATASQEPNEPNTSDAKGTSGLA
jgi:PAS domain S-box-containing protein